MLIKHRNHFGYVFYLSIAAYTCQDFFEKIKSLKICFYKFMQVLRYACI